MKHGVEIVILGLADGGRILRLTEPQSGLSLEKRLDPQESVARQKERWERVFNTVLEKELGAAG